MISDARKQRERLDSFLKVQSKEVRQVYCDPSHFRDRRGKRAKTVEKARQETQQLQFGAAYLDKLKEVEEGSKQVEVAEKAALQAERKVREEQEQAKKLAQKAKAQARKLAEKANVRQPAKRRARKVRL